MTAQETAAWLWYRRFIVFKITVATIFPAGLAQPPESVIISSVTLVALINACQKRDAWPGLAFFLLVCCQRIVVTWPFTINHFVFEAALLVLLAIDASVEEGCQDFSPLQMVRVLLLSVWIYSGMQKALHGYFWDGEFFVLEYCAAQTSFGQNLRACVHAVRSLGLLPKSAQLACPDAQHLTLSHAELAVFTAMGIGTLITEISAPLLLLAKSTRRLAFCGLLVFQISIGALSSEVDFAVTALASLFLYAPSHAPVVMKGLAIIYVAWEPWV